MPNHFKLVYVQHIFPGGGIWANVLDGLMKLNNRATLNESKIQINEQLSIKDMHLSIYIFDMKCIYICKCAKYMYKICNQIPAKEIMEKHGYVLSYHNFHIRQSNKQILIIPVCKSVQQQRHSVYRDDKAKLLNAML